MGDEDRANFWRTRAMNMSAELREALNDIASQELQLVHAGAGAGAGGAAGDSAHAQCEWGLQALPACLQ